MANWDKITKSSDNSASIELDFQPPVLTRDLQNSILKPQIDLTISGFEHNSMKHDISPVYRFENNYHTKHQNMNYHQSTNYQSRRHSVSTPQTKERSYKCKSQNQGINIVGLKNKEGMVLPFDKK